MLSIQFSISVSIGVASISVNGETKNLDTKYGLILSQQASGNDTNIFLNSFYFNDDLANKDIQILLTFTLKNKNSYTFPLITATYLPNTPPFFDGGSLTDS
jgi:hypothetical protein